MPEKLSRVNGKVKKNYFMMVLLDDKETLIYSGPAYYVREDLHPSRDGSI